MAPETKIDEPTDVEKHAASKQFAGKGEESDVFRSFSMPRTRRKHENTDVSTGTSLAPNTVTLVSMFLSLHREESNGAR